MSKKQKHKHKKQEWKKEANGDRVKLICQNCGGSGVPYDKLDSKTLVLCTVCGGCGINPNHPHYEYYREEFLEEEI